MKRKPIVTIEYSRGKEVNFQHLYNENNIEKTIERLRKEGYEVRILNK